LAESGSSIRVVKKKADHAGHHGGAWKVAYADFVTAMMAFFLVMWIVGLNQNIKGAIAGYFKDPVKFMAEVKAGNAPFTLSAMEGSSKIGPPGPESDANERAKLKLAKRTIEKIVAATPEFKEIKKYVDIKLTDEGLKINLLEMKESLFFDSASAKIKPSTAHLLARMTAELKKLPNKVIIEGHTDSRPLNRTDGYTNWELSADRSNSARRVMEAAGVRRDQIAQVRGYADTQPRNPSNPEHFSNRRVTILVVMTNALKRQQFGVLDEAR
jgi:chemotaxis protein MotB